MADDTPRSTSPTPSPARRRGRPSKRSAKLEREICNWVALGGTLRDFCRQPGRPAPATVYEWLQHDAAFSGRFAKCRLVGFDQIAEDALALADEPPAMVDGRVDGGHVAWTRTRIWTRLQLLSKWDPRRYGNKLAVDGEASVKVGVGAPMTDQECAKEIQAILVAAGIQEAAAPRGGENPPSASGGPP